MIHITEIIGEFIHAQISKSITHNKLLKNYFINNILNNYNLSSKIIKEKIK